MMISSKIGSKDNWKTDRLENIDFDSLDKHDKIPDYLEDKISVNVYNTDED